MKSFKERFNENYVAVKKTTQNKKGYKIEYVYHGPWYLWDVLPQTLIMNKYYIGTACVLDVAIFLLASIAYTDLNYAIFVEVPATLALIALLFQVIGVVQFCKSKHHMTKLKYQEITDKLKLFPLLRAVFMLLTFVASVQHMISVSFQSISLFVAVGYLLNMVLATFIFIRFRAVPFSSERNRILEDYKNNQNLGEVIEKKQ